MEKHTEEIILSIEGMKKELAQKEAELAQIRQNCQHQLPTNYETTIVSFPKAEGRFQTQEQVFRTCQKCGKRIFIDS